jgi:hypothetical protein
VGMSVDREEHVHAKGEGEQCDNHTLPGHRTIDPTAAFEPGILHDADYFVLQSICCQVAIVGWLGNSIAH